MKVCIGAISDCALEPNRAHLVNNYIRENLHLKCVPKGATKTKHNFGDVVLVNICEYHCEESKGVQYYNKWAALGALREDHFQALRHSVGGASFDVTEKPKVSDVKSMRRPDTSRAYLSQLDAWRNAKALWEEVNPSVHCPIKWPVVCISGDGGGFMWTARTEDQS